jgi:hypothetical protein
VTSLLVGLIAPASAAWADIGTFPDDPADSLVQRPDTEITSYSLRMDGSTVTVTAYLQQWDGAVDDVYFDFRLETTGDSLQDYEVGKTPVSAFTNGETYITQVGGSTPVPAGCTATVTSSVIASAISLSVPANCVGSPTSARVNVHLSRGSGASASEDWAPNEGALYSPWVSAGPSAPDGPVAKVYRFWSPGFGNAHFFTMSATEAAHIRQFDSNWIDEGAAFSAYPADTGSCAVGTSEVYRFYSPVFTSHFFTVSVAEKDHIIAADPNWTYEGVAYCAPTTQVPGSVPLYRFWSPVFGKHFYTASAAEAHQLDVNDPNWNSEGIAYYVLP